MNTNTRPTAVNFAQYTADPDAYQTIQDIPPEIAARLPGFRNFGINGDQLVEAVRQAGPIMGPATPGWAEHLMRYGDAAVALAEVAEAAGDTQTAESEFLTGSFWYFLARFPHIMNPGGAQAYQRHLNAYLRAAKHFTSPVEVLTIPFDKSHFTAFLRLPSGETPNGWPLVVIWGGIDIWKGDLEIHSQSNALLRQGIATLAIDMPGTGDSPLMVSPTAERGIVSAIDAIRQHPAINRNQIGCYGLSFGGYWAVKVALLYPDLVGVVNNAGPIHHTFQPAWVAALPMGTKIALARVLGIDPRANPQEMIAQLGALSLILQGLLPTDKHAPLLSLNGDEDEIVTIADLEIISEQGVKQDRLVFAHDRHVASRNWSLHEKFVADWFAQHYLVR